MTRHILTQTRFVVNRMGQMRTTSMSLSVRGLGTSSLSLSVISPHRLSLKLTPIITFARHLKVQKSLRKRQSRRYTIAQIATNPLSTEIIEIAVDYYSILKARRINSTELLKRSYENLLRYVPDVGYSKDTLNARKILLQRAAETMLDSDKRRDYDQILAHNETPIMTVEPRHFSGAMALLQESGEVTEVVELGTRWLNANSGNSQCRDVALAVAKAYCDLASITLSNGDGVVFCCEELEAALDLLTACHVAPQLQMEISGALKELAPQNILEQLALPDEPEFIEKRERAMILLKRMLWDVDENGTLSPELSDRQGFLLKAREHLTATQQIEIFESCPKNIEVGLEEMYDGAMAYIAEGYRAKWPQLIIKAEKVLQRVQLGSLTAIVGGSDVSVELGLCSLLLGETEKSMMHLGLRQGSTKNPDKDVVAFVVENSPNEEDLLPGLCALAEIWLKETILPNYKEINMTTSSLGEWFQSPRVSVYLRVLEQGKELNLLSAVRLSGSVAKGITSAVSRTFESFASIFRKPEFVRHSESDSVGRLKLPKVDISRLSQSPSAVETAGRASHITTASTLSTLKGEEMTQEDIASEGSRVQKLLNDGERAEENWWNEDRAATVTQPTNGQSMMKGHWTAVLIGSGLFVLIAAVITLAPRENIEIPGSIQTRFNKVADTVKGFFEETPAGTIDVPLAEELVRRWQIAKSEALGSSHDIDKLAEVLEGNMLKQWKHRAHTVKADGWHWEYTLVKLAVDKVSVGRDGKHATIEANIQEKAELIDAGRKADWYSSTYTVQYDLIMKRQGWRISAAKKLTQPIDMSSTEKCTPLVAIQLHRRYDG